MKLKIYEFSVAFLHSVNIQYCYNGRRESETYSLQNIKALENNINYTLCYKNQFCSF